MISWFSQTHLLVQAGSLFALSGLCPSLLWAQGTRAEFTPLIASAGRLRFGCEKSLILASTLIPGPTDFDIFLRDRPKE